MPKLTQQEMDEFLSEPDYFARFATVDEDGFPRVIPIVFLYHEGKIKFTLRPNSVPLKNVRRDPKVAFAFDERSARQRRVIVQGLARIVYEPGQESEWEDLYRQMLLKTMTDEEIDDYFRGSAAEGIARPWLEVDLAPPTRVKSWREYLDGEERDRQVNMAQQYLNHAPEPGWWTPKISADAQGLEPGTTPSH